MLYKKILYLLVLIIFSGCSTETLITNKIRIKPTPNFVNKGFTLIYNESLYKEKLITKKLDNRSLTIFQKNLNKNTIVKITNILNQKTLIAKVSSDALYPSFFNSVISNRIASELDLNLAEPYVEIMSVPKNSMFVAKQAKTYDEEKQVANKAPIDGISINNLNKSKKKVKKESKIKFLYKIKIADFYFKKTALSMIKRINNETNVKNPKIQKISDKKYRVYLGPFSNINSLQKSYNDINILKFENIEIIKND